MTKSLGLKAIPGAWRMYSARKADPRFKKYELKILQRDHYRCQFCGFQTKTYQEVINLDNNYANNQFNNMVTACCFCAQCFFIESVGVGGYGGGTLIYLPELKQSELNSLCNVLFCAITNDTGYKSSALEIYRSFKFRSQPIEDKYGEGTSDPSVFGQLVISTENHYTEMIDTIFKPVRLLPSHAKFRQQIQHWARTAIEEIVHKEA